MASRAQLKDALKRPELERPGVYVLTGEGEEGASKLYIGEADVLKERLAQHARGDKEFWTQFIVFTSTNEGLNKANIRYLESKLIKLAKEASQWELDNNSDPNVPSLSEADRADADWFLSEMLVIYPLLGVDAFEKAKNLKGGGSKAPELVLEDRYANGRGKDTPEGFIVFKGSKARKDEVQSIPGFIKELRSNLLSRGVLKEIDGALVFQQDFRFNSPSTAASVLMGRNENGRTAWKTKTGQTLKEYQEAQLSGH